MKVRYINLIEEGALYKFHRYTGKKISAMTYMGVVPMRRIDPGDDTAYFYFDEALSNMK